MRSRFRHAIMLGVVLWPAACKSASGGATNVASNPNESTTPRAFAFTPLHNGINSGFASKSEFVIQDVDEFTRRWRGILQGSPDAALPAVDFSKNTVVLVAIGSRNTGGHSVRIDSLIAASGNTTVHYTVTSPGARCMSLQVLTAPVEVISTERLPGAVRFSRRSVTGPC